MEKNVTLRYAEYLERLFSLLKEHPNIEAHLELCYDDGPSCTITVRDVDEKPIHVMINTERWHWGEHIEFDIATVFTKLIKRSTRELEEYLAK